VKLNVFLCCDVSLQAADGSTEAPGEDQVNWDIYTAATREEDTVSFPASFQRFKPGSKHDDAQHRQGYVCSRKN